MSCNSCNPIVFEPAPIQLGGGGSSVSWGAISGTLSAQTDLVNVLAGKSNISHNHSVDSLSNVVITSIADNEVLSWDTATSKWVNTAIAPSGGVWGAITGTLSAQTDLVTALGLKSDTSHNHSIDSLSNVVITSIADNEVLSWDTATSKWVNTAIASSGGVWGAISGTLSAQTDLMTILNGKADDPHTHVWADITDTADSAVNNVTPSIIFQKGNNSGTNSMMMISNNVVGGGGNILDIKQATGTANKFIRFITGSTEKAYIDGQGNYVCLTSFGGFSASNSGTFSATNTAGTLQCKMDYTYFGQINSGVWKNKIDATVGIMSAVGFKLDIASKGVGKVLTSDANGVSTWEKVQSSNKIVRVATTGANIIWGTALNSGDVIDGITLADGDRVLVKDQLVPSENGIYVVANTPFRAVDFNSDMDIRGYNITVQDGTLNKNCVFECLNSTTITVGTTDLIFKDTFTEIANNRKYIVTPPPIYDVLAGTHTLNSGFISIAGSGSYMPYAELRNVANPANWASGQSFANFSRVVMKISGEFMNNTGVFFGLSESVSIVPTAISKTSNHVGLLIDGGVCKIKSAKLSTAYGITTTSATYTAYQGGVWLLDINFQQYYVDFYLNSAFVARLAMDSTNMPISSASVFCLYGLKDTTQTYANELSCFVKIK